MSPAEVSDNRKDTWVSRARLVFDRYNGDGIAGSVLLVFAFAYVIIRGTFARGAKDIDTRYFFVAGKVWLKGQSPYDFSSYREVWKSYFTEDIAQGGFAYLPGSIFYSAPLGLFDWPTAAILFRTINIAAVVLIILIGISYVRRHAGITFGLRHYAWLAFGIMIGGVPGTILTGQSSVIVCAATLSIAALPLRLWPLMFPAMIVASSKPQIAGPILAVVFFADRPARWRLAATVVGAIAVSAVVLFQNSASATLLLQAIRGNANLGANDPTRMIGLAPLLRFLPIGQSATKVLGWLALSMAVVLVARHASRNTTPAHRLMPTAMIAAFVSMGLAYPYHGYDTAMFAPACAVVGLLSGRRQLLCLPVFAVIGRPRLLSWAMTSSSVAGTGENTAENTIVGVSWLFAVVAIIYWGVSDFRRRGPPIGLSSKPDLSQNVH